MMKRLAGAVAALGIIAGSASLGMMPAGAETYVGSAAQQLAEKYAPVVKLQKHLEECSGEGEAFRPMAVDPLLGNPQIAMRQSGNYEPVVRRGPKAANLFNHGDGFFLDFPGMALSPGCTYEKDYHRFTDGQRPAIYAHVVSQGSQLAVQYWFFWYYNEWNNKHEGDWEGIQIVFPVDTAEKALTVDPISTGYAQHEGGESAPWGDDKIEMQAGHPVVYPSVGSHASYYGSALHMGRSGSEGFGCDDTTGPSTQLRPQVILLPENVHDAKDRFAWLDFGGRWGELQSGPYSGPTGPTDKGRWTQPIDWQEGLRTSSVIVPTGSTRSGEIVDSFCGVVEFGSNQLTAFLRSPAEMALALFIIGSVALFLIRRTRWNRTELLPIVRKRRTGQILHTAGSLLLRHPRAFFMTGVTALPIAFLAGLCAVAFQHLPFFSSLSDATEASRVPQLLLSLFASALASAAALTFCSAMASVLMRDVESGKPASVLAAARVVLSRIVPLISAFAFAAVILELMIVTVILVPVAIYLLIRMQFIAQAVMLDHSPSGWQALRRSGELTRRRWFHTAIAIALITVSMPLIAGTVALVVLVLVQPPFWVLSVLVVALEVLIAPFAAVGTTYLYGDSVAGKQPN